MDVRLLGISVWTFSSLFLSSCTLDIYVSEAAALWGSLVILLNMPDTFLEHTSIIHIILNKINLQKLFWKTDIQNDNITMKMLCVFQKPLNRFSPNLNLLSYCLNFHNENCKIVLNNHEFIIRSLMIKNHYIMQSQ